MSSLIEQAVIDAKELRAAALLTAESQIVEKYAGEIKEAMSSLLEQDPEEELGDLGMADAPMGDLGDPGEEVDKDVEDIDVPTSGVPTEGDSKDFVTLNMDELKTMVDALAADDAEEGELKDPLAMLGDTEENRPEEVEVELSDFERPAPEEEEASLFEGIELTLEDEDIGFLDEEELEEDLDEAGALVDIDPYGEDLLAYSRRSGEEEAAGLRRGRGITDVEPGMPEEEPIVHPDPSELEWEDPEEEEEWQRRPIARGRRNPSPKLGIFEDDIQALAEELTVKIMDGDFTGWAGRPEKDIQYQEKINLARLASTEAQEENEDLQAGMKKLALKYESLAAKNTKLAKTVIALKERLDEITLSNAKLLFQNEALTNTSLNRRQKEQFVESIRRAESANDAKVIYETLQSTVPARRKTSEPESLHEAIRRPSHTIPRREIMHNSVESGEKRRFQILAGIQSNKQKGD